MFSERHMPSWLFVESQTRIVTNVTRLTTRVHIDLAPQRAMEDDAVPDSEGEEYLPVVRNPVKKTPAPTDSISSFPVKPVPSTKESISSSSSAAPPKARPKPKPLFKGAPAAVARPAAGDSSIIESYSGMTASERVKMRSRGALKPSTPDLISTPATRMPVSSEIVDISDSDDELAFAKAKPRPKVHAKASASTASSPSSSNGPPMPSPNQLAPKRPTLPPPFPYASSPLPASDVFPLSTATTHQPPDDDDFVPPIVTLTTSVVSSPSVSKTQKLTIKLPPLKPPSSDRFDSFDELDDRGGGMAPPLHPTGAFPVDPGPSSSSAGPATDGAPPAKPPKKSRKKKEKGAEEGEAEREKPAKKPRTKKVKAGAGAEEGGSEQEKPMPKKKQGTGTGKGKEKEKAFPSAEFIQSEDDDEPVDGALPPLRSLVDVAGLSEKPISVISIPDSQPDEEELTLVVGEKRKRVDEGERDDGAAYGDSEAVDDGKAKTDAKKKSKKVKTALAPAATTPAVDKGKTKKGPAKKAKRKTVMSDEEGGAVSGGEGATTVLDSEGAPASPPQTTVVDETREDEKLKPAKSKKTRKTVVSDSDGEEETETVRPAKKRKTKAIVADSDAEGDDDDALFQNKNKPNNENSPPRPSSESHVENVVNNKPPSNPGPKKNLEETPKPSISSKYTISPRTKSTPMAELIRRVSARPGSPFPVVARRGSLGGGAGSNPGTPTTTYSPHHKFSRSRQTASSSRFQGVQRHSYADRLLIEPAVNNRAMRESWQTTASGMTFMNNLGLALPNDDADDESRSSRMSMASIATFRTEVSSKGVMGVMPRYYVPEPNPARLSTATFMTDVSADAIIPRLPRRPDSRATLSQGSRGHQRTSSIVSDDENVVHEYFYAKPSRNSCNNKATRFASSTDQVTRTYQGPPSYFAISVCPSFSAGLFPAFKTTLLQPDFGFL
ncbi:hypothetical protein DFH08DRAFT_1016306 [Mycena albidolilacea]|uniref:Uncharacterized protein n=1 Tax=Mycena albidolilacea TaxID=1033008 RepID=A0AAD7ANV8_9AGAR|nr:hypothetical protein DFH08DRAFT_1016306 [Mycena albidolilacea]